MHNIRWLSPHLAPSDITYGACITIRKIDQNTPTIRIIRPSPFETNGVGMLSMYPILRISKALDKFSYLPGTSGFPYNRRSFQNHHRLIQQQTHSSALVLPKLQGIIYATRRRRGGYARLRPSTVSRSRNTDPCMVLAANPRVTLGVHTFIAGLQSFIKM